MRRGVFETHPWNALRRPPAGTALRASLLCIVVIGVMTVALQYGIQTGPTGMGKSERDQASTKSSLHVSGLAQLVSERWASARVEVIRELKALSTAEAPDAALQHFIASTPERLKGFEQVDQLAESTLLKLVERQREMADPHYQALLPAEVIPELGQAITDHIRAVTRIQNETRTLRSQTLPDIEARLGKLTEAVRIKGQLSGPEAAQKMWQSGVNEITSFLSGE